MGEIGEISIYRHELEQIYENADPLEIIIDDLYGSGRVERDLIEIQNHNDRMIKK
jgi:hypothetical protein